MHAKQEVDNYMQAAAEYSLKLACICSDYENNQMVLMKRNRVASERSRLLEGLLAKIEQAVSNEKIKSTAVASSLQEFKQIPPLL